MGEVVEHNVFERVVHLIEEARTRAFVKVNEELVLLYFNVGRIVSDKVAAGDWGDNTVGQLAEHIRLTVPSSGGFTRRGLYRMKQFYERYAASSEVFSLWLNSRPQPFPTANHRIVSTAMTQLQISDSEHFEFVSTVLTQIPWTGHLHILGKSRSAEESIFYLELARKEALSVRELERQINTSLFERSKLFRQKVSALPSQLPMHLFKDPFVFEFLNLPEGHSELDLEQALVKNLQKFILEIGQGYAYMGRQYRIQVGNKDYRTDLLFYHRDLQCLVLFELKTTEFEPEFLGKLNFYLEALDRDVRRPHEQPSIGILLCKGKDTEVVEYSMARNVSPAVIADYETRLIPKKLLADKLHQLSEQLTAYAAEMGEDISIVNK